MGTFKFESELRSCDSVVCRLHIMAGGATPRVKVSNKEISKATEKKNQYVSFDDFMAENPKIKNDLYVSRMHLLDGVNWMKLDCGLEKSDYKDCDSLYRILMHKEEIMNNAW